jgi:pilus assembly protein FimV
MSSGKNPLVLMMALSMPGAAHAIGLGEIHVDSALNERLAAEIDIVGATALELEDLKAAVANRETFAHYGADRPAFLGSTTFTVTQDKQGRPVLAVRSSESFTEPVINFLVDLNWRNGQIIRQYTLLLDPAGLGAAPTPVALPAATVTAAPVAPAAKATAPAPATALATTADADPARSVRKTTHIKVGAKATLRGIAWRAGERSESDLQRMMLAIFRANPNAFDGNINRLHRGAVLTIPSHAELATISRAEAKSEIHAQMAAWHSPAAAANRTVPARIVAANAAPAATTPAIATAAASTPATSTPAISARATETPGPQIPSAAAVAGTNESDALAAAALGHRVQSLELELSQMQSLMRSERDQLLALQRQSASPAAPASPLAESVRTGASGAQPASAHVARAPMIAGLGVLAAAVAAVLFRFRRRKTTAGRSPIGSRDVTPDAAGADTAIAGTADADTVAAGDLISDAVTADSATARLPVAVQDATPDSLSDFEATHPALPRLAEIKPAGRSEIAAKPVSSANLDDTTINAPHDATVNLQVATLNLRMDPTRLDYNFLDLDLTAQHVQMPSVLNEHAVVKERRTNLADVLKLAIEREPDRHDLRMKLLELYYSAAATNRKAFLDVVQNLARNRDHLQSDQWDKIAFMGRQIAAESPLFSEQPDDEDLADCA